jgi:hypothetical protein
MSLIILLGAVDMVIETEGMVVIHLTHMLDKNSQEIKPNHQGMLVFLS